MKMNKEKFLKTELGSSMEECISLGITGSVNLKTILINQ